MLFEKSHIVRIEKNFCMKQYKIKLKHNLDFNYRETEIKFSPNM